MPNTFTAGRILAGNELSRLAAAISGMYRVPASAGGAVTTNSNMAPSVSAITAGMVTVNGVLDLTGQAGNTVTVSAADATNPRRDWVYYEPGVGFGVTAGIPAPYPALPALTAGRIALAEVYVAANDTSIDAGDIIDRRAGGPETPKYKIATQTVSASTAFVTVTAAGGNMDFPIAASETVRARIYLPLTFTSTGGAKFQLTGPSAPTTVNITGLNDRGKLTDNTSPLAVTLATHITPVTAFSSDIEARAAAGNSSSATDAKYSFTDGGLLILDVLIVNGANAGTVTLQFAQQNGAGTVVIGIGAYMEIIRMKGFSL